MAEAIVVWSPPLGATTSLVLFAGHFTTAASVKVIIPGERKSAVKVRIKILCLSVLMFCLLLVLKWNIGWGFSAPADPGSNIPDAQEGLYHSGLWLSNFIFWPVAQRWGRI